MPSDRFYGVSDGVIRTKCVQLTAADLTESGRGRLQAVGDHPRHDVAIGHEADWVELVVVTVLPS
jgi:ribonucleotide monophosphatase NagD (HAD superfamily)